MEHTEGEWRAIDYRGGGWIVEAVQSDHQVVVAMINAHDNAKANAERIVKAVNCHDDLYEALKVLLKWAELSYSDDTGEWADENDPAIVQTKQALAKVKA